MANPAPVHPLTAMFKARGVNMDDGTKSLNDVTSQVLQNLGEAANAKVGADIIKEIMTPPAPPDPLDQVTKLATLAGMRNAEDEREEKRLARERQERIDQERFDEQRRLSAQSQSLEMMKFMMQMSQTQADTTNKLILQMSQDNQKLIERMETNTREMVNRIGDKSKESDIDKVFREKALATLLAPAPDPIEELQYHKERLTALGLVGQPSNAPNWQLDLEIKREELQLRREEMQAKQEIEKLKAENQGKQLASGFEMVMGLLAQRNAQNADATAQGAPSGPPKTVPMAHYVCDKCEHEWIDAYGIQHIICPSCKEHLEVNYPS